jgi:hypothetical protein
MISHLALYSFIFNKFQMQTSLGKFQSAIALKKFIITAEVTPPKGGILPEC